MLRRALACLLLAVALPAAAAEPRTLQFSGYTWVVKSSAPKRRVGPGPNFFSAAGDHVWVDAHGWLHLKIAKDADGKWRCAEVYLLDSLGYGTYRFVTGKPLDDLDPNVVLGLFTYSLSDDPSFAYRELDFEYSRWGEPSDPTNAQVVVQPYDQPGNLHRWTVPSGYPVLTHRMDWSASAVKFSVRQGDTVLEHLDYRKAERIPPPGDETVHLNLWLSQGRVPQRGKATEIVIRSFSFTPP